MFKSFLIFLFFFCFAFCEAQTNLIYNGDFELYDTCPQHESWAGMENPYQIEHCLGWKAPTYASSDYFNVCNNSINGFVGVPSNILGNQNTYSGSGYLGFFAYSDTGSCGCPGAKNWIEYVQSRLIQPLVQGHTYKLSFYVSLAEGGEIAVSNIGAYFSSTAISGIDYRPFQGITPQVRNPIGNYLADTINWIKIEGQFIAQGGEEYITISNFDDTLNYDTIRIKPYNYFSIAYYYLDYLEMVDLSEVIEPVNVFSPNSDGVNDLFLIKGLIVGDKVKIYNRWGTLVYEFAGVNDGWDGRTTSGQESPEGVYYYIIERKESEAVKGFIQLLR